MMANTVAFVACVSFPQLRILKSLPEYQKTPQKQIPEIDLE